MEVAPAEPTGCRRHNHPLLPPEAHQAKGVPCRYPFARDRFTTRGVQCTAPFALSASLLPQGTAEPEWPGSDGPCHLLTEKWEHRTLAIGRAPRPREKLPRTPHEQHDGKAWIGGSKKERAVTWVAWSIRPAVSSNRRVSRWIASTPPRRGDAALAWGSPAPSRPYSRESAGRRRGA
jgi:hypothetical protein